MTDYVTFVLKNINFNREINKINLDLETHSELKKNSFQSSVFHSLLPLLEAGF